MKRKVRMIKAKSTLALRGLRNEYICARSRNKAVTEYGGYENKTAVRRVTIKYILKATLGMKVFFKHLLMGIWFFLYDFRQGSLRSGF
jgi:hypothetical protein